MKLELLLSLLLTLLLSVPLLAQEGEEEEKAHAPDRPSLIKGVTTRAVDTDWAPKQLPDDETRKKTKEVYETVEMHPRYKKIDRAKRLHYFTKDEQREPHRIVIYKGHVYNHEGKLVGSIDGGPEMDRKKIHYVMDAAGNIYIFDEKKDPKTRHSSIFAGGPVASAGEIKIRKGRVQYINSDSGHYPQAKTVLKNLFKELEKNGVDISEVENGDITDKEEPSRPQRRR